MSNLRGFSGFREMLAARQKAVNSLICMGLDPLVEKVPTCLRKGDGSVDQGSMATWLMDMSSASAEFVSLYKPQKAHYEALYDAGIDGSWVLRKVVSHLNLHFPDIPVFLDCKRGDIGRTQERYRIAHFSVDGVDGMNFSPYMGKDCMEYLVSKDHPGHAIVGLCYTSNSSAREVQDVKLADGRQYWEFMAETILKWAEKLGVIADAGLVMAAAFENPKGSGNIFSYHLSRGREIVGNKLWFLIPGIGTQGGFVEETVRAAFSGPGSIAINSSSGITFASAGEDFAEAAAREAKKLRDQIRAAGGNC